MKTTLLAVGLCLSAAALAAPGKLKLNLDPAKLGAGELQLFDSQLDSEGEGQKRRVVGVQLINAPPAKVWALLRDWDGMSGWVPGLKYYKTLAVLKTDSSDGVQLSVIEGRLKAPMLTIEYTLQARFDTKLLRSDWRLISAEELAAYRQRGIAARVTGGSYLKSVEGFGYLEPYGDGSKTVYTYAPVVETAVAVPSFIDRSITQSSLRDYMLAVKARAEGK